MALGHGALPHKAQGARRRLPLVALLHEPIQAGFLTSGLGPEVYACGLELRIRVLRAIWARGQDHNEVGNLFHGRRGEAVPNLPSCRALLLHSASAFRSFKSSWSRSYNIC